MAIISLLRHNDSGRAAGTTVSSSNTADINFVAVPLEAGDVYSFRQQRAAQDVTQCPYVRNSGVSTTTGVAASMATDEIYWQFDKQFNSWDTDEEFITIQTSQVEATGVVGTLRFRSADRLVRLHDADALAS